MGAMKEQAVTRHEGPKAKGSGIDWGSANQAATGSGVSWNDADPPLLASVVFLATRTGMAVSFSATANGQGVSVTFLDGSARPKWYANTPEELGKLLAFLLDLLPAPR